MTTALIQLDAEGRHDELIDQLRDEVASNPRRLAEPDAKAWCGKRWRDLFLSAAAADDAAVACATKSGLLGRREDPRPVRQRLAERFIRGENLKDWQLELPAGPTPKLQQHTLIFAPGLLNGMLPTRAFHDALPDFQQQLGWQIVRADLHPMRSCSANISDLRAALEQGLGLHANANRRIDPATAKPPGKVIIVAYSKGMPDTLELLAKHPELGAQVSAIFNWGGAVGGSYLADDIYQTVEPMKIEKTVSTLTRLLSVISPVVQVKGAFERMAEFDIKAAVHDLTTSRREAFLAENGAALDALNIPIFNLSGSTTVTEAPYFQMQGVLELNKYDANNDMQLTQLQAKYSLPMGTDLCMLRGHHWDISYNPFPKTMRFGSPNLDHPFPKPAALMAMMQLAVELGLAD